MYTPGFVHEAEPWPDVNGAVMSHQVGATTNRKRSRTSEQDACEFMPISKRINQLHIRSNNVVNSDVDDESGDSLLQMTAENMGETSCGAASEGSASSGAQSSQLGPQHRVPHYDPNMSEQENPYYFHINCMLFELHLQRITRHSTNNLPDRPPRL